MQALEVARAALAAGDRAAALAALIEAWRATRDARIAELVEHVSDELVASHAPTVGVTGAAFREVTDALATATPVVLGRLLSTPWPRRSEQLARRLRVLIELPPDPRVARVLARRLGALASWTEVSEVAAHLVVLGDQRTRAELAAWNVRVAANRAARFLAALDDAQRPVEPATAAVIDAIEHELGAEVARRKALRRGSEDLLAALAADPENLDLCSVHADALIAANDPRGELAALQIARARTGAMVGARERALIVEHGITWAGALAGYFDARGLVYELGRFAGGVLRPGPEVTSFDDPAWRFVRVVEAGTARAIAVIQALPRVRQAVVEDVGHAAQLAGGATLPHLVDLRVASAASLAGVDVCAALPGLVTLGVRRTPPRELVRFARAAPVIERLERLVIVTDRLGPDLVPALAERGGVRELVVMSASMPISGRAGPGWTVVLRRDEAPGPFTSIVARHHPPKPVPSATWVTNLLAILRGCPRGVAELRVDAPARVLASADRARLATGMAELAPVVAHVPWAPPGPPAPAPEGLAVGFVLDGDGLLEATRAVAAWQLLAGELAQGYDLFSVGDSATLRAIGGDPLATLATWIARAPTRRLSLRRDGTRARVWLDRPGASTWTVAEGVLECGALAPRAIVDAILRLLELGTFRRGQVSLDTRTQAYSIGAYGNAPCDAWLMVFGDPALVSRLPLAGVEALARRPELAGMFAVAHRAYLVVGAAATPDDATPARTRAVGRALRELLYPRLEFDPRARAGAVLGDLARELRLTPDVRDPFALDLRWVSSDDRGLVVDVNLRDPFGRSQVRVLVTWSPGGRQRKWRWFDWVDTPDALAFEAALRRHAALVLAEVRTWLATA